MHNMKIRISNNAYNYFIKLLQFHDEYDCIHITKSKAGCGCRGNSLDVYLDNVNDHWISNKVDSLVICYDEDISINYSHITIILKENKIYIKAINENILPINLVKGGCSKKQS